MIDSSAILAIAFQEPEAERMATAIAAASTRKMCTVNWLETLMVVEGRYGPESADDTLLLLQELGVEPISFDRNQMVEARTAWRRFGKGHHPASLNLGDCCAYAAAVTTAEPLLFKGNDFPQTDISRAEW
jgi:ribonuclease VapC